MKLLLVLAVVIAAVFAESLVSDSQSFPCTWNDRLKIPKIDDQIYQCQFVTGKTLLRYSLAADDPSDNFQVLILNDTQYANYRSGRYFTCVNEPQCRYGDPTTKQGSYTLQGNGGAFFVVVKDSNLFERAFISSAVSFSPIGSGPVAPFGLPTAAPRSPQAPWNRPPWFGPGSLEQKPKKN